MTKVSILGCGWLGMPLGEHLLEKGYQVSGSTTRQTRLSEISAAGIKPFLVDFNAQEFDPAFFNTDVLVIAIPPRLKSGGEENYFFQMETAAHIVFDSNVSKVIFISTTSVYPDLNRVVTETDADESTPLFKAENIFRRSTRFNTTILRFAGLVGPGRHPGRFLAGKKNISGADNPVNILHQRDCVGIISAIITQSKWNETFNACADHHPSKKEFYSQMSALLDLDQPQFSNEAAPFKIVSSAKLKHSLEYPFTFPDPLKMFP